MERWTDNTTGEQAAKDAAQYVAAAEQSESKLLHVPWPPSVAADVKNS
jgi:hypothetical protein